MREKFGFIDIRVLAGRDLRPDDFWHVFGNLSNFTPTFNLAFSVYSIIIFSMLFVSELYLSLHLNVSKFSVFHIVLLYSCYPKNNFWKIYHQLRARMALSLFNDVPLRTRRALLMYKVYNGERALTVLSGTLLNSINAVPVPSQ